VGERRNGLSYGDTCSVGVSTSPSASTMIRVERDSGSLKGGMRDA
jgi:hypothetical protein